MEKAPKGLRHEQEATKIKEISDPHEGSQRSPTPRYVAVGLGTLGHGPDAFRCLPGPVRELATLAGIGRATSCTVLLKGTCHRIP